MSYFVLIYDVVEGFVERRAPLRAAHLQYVREAHARGDIFMAGAFGDPPEGAILVFRTQAADVVEVFARQDPYVTQGLVTRWRVAPWTVVVGP